MDVSSYSLIGDYIKNVENRILTIHNFILCSRIVLFILIANKTLTLRFHYKMINLKKNESQIVKEIIIFVSKSIDLL